jgi:hypothetical protein
MVGTADRNSIDGAAPSGTIIVRRRRMYGKYLGPIERTGFEFQGLARILGWTSRP